MKIQRIEVKDFKAIQHAQLDLNGSHVLLIGGNGTGKSTLGRIVEILQSKTRPPVPLRDGAQDGFVDVQLTDGTAISWKFDQAGNLLTLIDKDGKVVKKPSQIISAMVGTQFSIEEFLNEQPAKQRKMLCQIAGIDLDDLDKRYKAAYDQRTEDRRVLNASKARAATHVEAAQRQSVSELVAQLDQMAAKNKQYEEAVAKREKIEAELNEALAKRKGMEEVLQQAQALSKIITSEDVVSKLSKIKLPSASFPQGTAIVNAANTIVSAVNDFYNEGIAYREGIDELKLAESALSDRLATANEYIPKMTRFSEDQIAAVRAQIEDVDANNAKAQAYEQYLAALAEVERDQRDYDQSDLLVREIEAERKRTLEANPLPADGLEFGEDGLMLNGLPFNDSQVATSAKMIAAAQISASLMGELKFLHFDASILDKESADKLMAWADSQGLQIALERVDWGGGELRYEIYGG